MKKKLIARIFIIISIIFIVSLFGIYGYRLVHYYKLEHPKNQPLEEKEVTLKSTIMDANPVQDSGDGLYEEEEQYYFQGKNVNNYVLYSGIIWRIVSLNTDSSITLISDTPVTSLVFGYETNDYKNSYVSQWLNEDFYEKISGTNLVDTTYCVDQITDSNNVKCEKEEKNKVGMLSVSSYLKSGGSKGYINQETPFWTVNPGEENHILYVNEKGTVTDDEVSAGNYHSYGVRPMITIDGKEQILSGKGTKEEPYQIGKNESKVLQEQTIGNYVNYSNQVWRIIGKDELGVKLALNGTLEIEEENLKEFSDESSLYSIKKRDNIGYYLNSTYYRMLENKEYLVEYPWEILSYTEEEQYNYKNKTENIVKTEVGLLQVGDLFLNDFSEYDLMTVAGEDTVWMVKEDGRLYANMTIEEAKVRPVVVLKGDIAITEGTGTLKSPFTLGAA